jgi:hypothetical protein
VRRRPVLVLALLPALLAGGAAVAAPAKPVCGLISDAKGDGAVVASANDLDIVGGDLASDSKKITAVLELAGDPAAVNPQALGGKNYYVSFVAPGSPNPQFLSAEFDPLLGASYSTGFEEDVNGVGNKTSDVAPATGKVVGNKIFITAPISNFGGRASLRPGKKLTGLTGEVFALIGTSVTGGLLALADDATGAGYTTGAASCVAVGR